MIRRTLKWMMLLAVLCLVFAAGWLLSRRTPESTANETHGATEAAGAAKPKQLWTCSMHPQVIREEPGYCPICHMKLVPVEMSARSEAPAAMPGMGKRSRELNIDPAVVRNMGIQLASVQRGPLKKTIRAAGFLRSAEPLRYDINLRLSGWIEQLSADTVGMRIAKGQKLFELYSPQLAVAVRELIAARQAADGAGGDAAGALYESARQKLHQWGLSEQQVNRLASMKSAPNVIPFFSPIDGILTEKSVVAGSVVQAGQRVMRLVDYRTLWLDAQVYPQDLPWISMDQSAEATFDSMPTRTWNGHVIFIDPTVNPTDRTTTVRIALDNPELELRPGMYATVQFTATAKNDALLAPRSAIIDTGKRQVAFVSRGNGHFQPRDVEMGLAGSDDRIEILSGLQAGEQVVVSGQFLLDADSRMQEAVREYLQSDHDAMGAHDHSPAPAATPAHAPHQDHATTHSTHGDMQHDSKDH